MTTERIQQILGLDHRASSVFAVVGKMRLFTMALGAKLGT